MIGAPWFKRLSYRGDNGTVAGPAIGTQLRPGNLSDKRSPNRGPPRPRPHRLLGCQLRASGDDTVEAPGPGNALQLVLATFFELERGAGDEVLYR